MTEALYPDSEQRTVFVYADASEQPSAIEQYTGDTLQGRQLFEYDDRGRLLRKASDHGGDGTVELEERWQFDSEAHDWIGYEKHQHGAPVEHVTRTYQGADILTQTIDFADGSKAVSRYFPGAPPEIIQPVHTRWELIVEKQVACKSDSDCVVIPAANCCDCTSGGSGVVVNRRHATAVRRAIKKACSPAAGCPAMISHHPTCDTRATPVCYEHICTLSLKR